MVSTNSLQDTTLLWDLGKAANLFVIGVNVVFGASVTIIGNVQIGNNVLIGAGSVVVKHILDNCVAAGNPE